MLCNCIYGGRCGAHGSDTQVPHIERCCVFTKKKGLTGWMFKPWGLMEIPVGEMPTRGAPMFTPVAERLMPTGDVLMKQGL